MFEIRKNDRDYQLGDFLYLQEYDPGSRRYTGREQTAEVTYVLQGGQFGIEEGYVIMGIKRLQRASARLPKVVT